MLDDINPRLDRDAPIFVAGHQGMVGSALVRRLAAGGYTNLILRDRKQLDLIDQRAVSAFLRETSPAYIFLAAAKVGGIGANDRLRADFLYENLQIEANVIHGAHLANVQRLMFLGSSCIYPRDCPQPIREDFLLTGPLEPTNEPYAIAKIAGLKLCESYNRQYGRRYACVMPTNLYGENDNFDLATGHVLPALIRKAHEAKIDDQRVIKVWGSGTPRREFLYVDDLADACVFLMESSSETGWINVGSGVDISILELAELVVDVVDFRGDIIFDRRMPDGTPRKLLDVSRIQAMGWRARTGLREGIERTYASFIRRAEETPRVAA